MRHARVGGVLTGGLGDRNVSIRTPKVRKAAVLFGLTWDHLLAKTTRCSCRIFWCVGRVCWARIVSLPPAVPGWSSRVVVVVFSVDNRVFLRFDRDWPGG